MCSKLSFQTDPKTRFETVADDPIRSWNRILIFMILLGASVAVALRCYYWEPVSDDLLYSFVLDEHTLGENDYSVHVTGIKDALRSQCTQYFYSNGRLPIHVLVQMFAGPWGRTAFVVFIGCLMFSTLIMSGIYCFPKAQYDNPLLWLCVALTYIYSFGVNSIAGCMNYILPMFLIMCFLLLLRYYRSCQKKTSKGLMMVLIILGVMVGWTQECYTLPLSCGLFFILLYDYNKHMQVSRIYWLLAISFWVGTAILVLAPGNFVRLSAQPNILVTLIKGAKYLGGTYVFWVMLACLFLLRLYDKDRFVEFLFHNRLVGISLCVALCFGMVANTLPQSFNGILFYSLVLLFRMSYYIPLLLKRENRRIVMLLTYICIIAASVHQIRIIDSCRKVQEINHNFVLSYLRSNDGVVAIPEIILSEDVKPFVHNWFTSSVSSWLMLTLEQYYTNGAKPLIPIPAEDYVALNSPDRFIQKYKNLSVTISGVFRGKEYLWFSSEARLESGDSIDIRYARIIHADRRGLRSRIISLLFPQNNDSPVEIRSVKISPATTIGDGKGLIGVNVGDKKIEKITIYRNDK